MYRQYNRYSIGIAVYAIFNYTVIGISNCNY